MGFHAIQCKGFLFYREKQMRIRTIKPEFWAHPVMAKQSDSTKLMAIGLLNVADDDGYFFADPRMIRNAVRPLDDDSRITTVAIRELSGIGYIEVRNHATHGDIGFIPSFKNHQVINKPKASKIKAFFDDTTDTVSIPDSYRLEGNREQGNREQGNREQGNREQGNKERKGAGKKRVDDALPLPFDSADFVLFWNNWEQHLKEKKKPLQPTGRKMQLNKLKEMGETRAIAALKHSMANNWQGIFEPDTKRNKSGGTYADRHINDTEQLEIPDA